MKAFHGDQKIKDKYIDRVKAHDADAVDSAYAAVYAAILDKKEIEQQALKEIEEEEFKNLVQAEKEKIRATRQKLKGWKRLFPFDITFKIERIKNVGH